MSDQGIPSSLPFSSSQKQNQNGIDIRQALEILAARAPHKHVHDDGDDGGGSGGTNGHDEHGHCHDHGHIHGGCCNGSDVDGLSESSQQILRTMGQTIDMLAPSSSSPSPSSSSSPSFKAAPSNNACATKSDTKPLQELQRKDDEKTHTDSNDDDTDNDKTEKSQKDKIEEHLATMSVVDLLQAVLSSQEQRVRTYRTYEQSLEQVLVSGNLTNYPPACAAATATFAVLSDTIRAVQQELERRASGFRCREQQRGEEDTAVREQHEKHASQSQHQQWKEEAQHIHKLQSLEREKLQLTAACHLERIRERNQREELKIQNNSNSNRSEERILSLLREGVTSLQHKIKDCTQQINDVLEEVRCALVDEMGDIGE